MKSGHTVQQQEVKEEKDESCVSNEPKILTNKAAQICHSSYNMSTRRMPVTIFLRCQHQ